MSRMFRIVIGIQLAMSLIVGRVQGVTISGTADEHGDIEPLGAVTITNGGATNFLITADPYYYISEILTNGSPAPLPGITNLIDFTWSDITTDSTIHARFAPSLEAYGTPDWWLASYGWTNDFSAAATNDEDRDGMITWQEYYADTDPTNCDSFLGLTRSTHHETNVTLAWSCEDNLYYHIGYSTNLLTDPFSRRAASFVATPLLSDTVTHTVAGAWPAASYRVEVDTTGWTQFAGWAVGALRQGYGTILHTEDGGHTWVRQGSPAEIADIAFNGVSAVDGHTAWVVGNSAAGYGTIYRTTNAGATWLRQGSTSEIPNVALSKVSSINSNIAWVAGQSATILHTTNAGTTWTLQPVAGYTNAFFQGVFALNASNAWVTGHSDGGFATIFRTTDAGSTWTRQTNGAITNIDHILGISAVSTDEAWAVGANYTIIHTRNGGQTWEQQYTGVSNFDANEVYAVNTSLVWVACDHNALWTTNGGASWEGQTTADYTMGVSSVATQHCWMVVSGIHGYIFHTADGGQHWTEQPIPNSSIPPLWTVSFAPKTAQ